MGLNNVETRHPNNVETRRGASLRRAWCLQFICGFCAVYKNLCGKPIIFPYNVETRHPNNVETRRPNNVETRRGASLRRAWCLQFIY